MRLVKALSILLTLFALACFIGCSSEVEETKTSSTNSSEASEESLRASCVAEFAKRPCELLNEQLIRASLTDVPAEIKNTRHDKAFHSCMYSWPSKRVTTMTVMGRSMEIKEDNQVSLSWIKTYKDSPEKRFRRAYLPTEEEQKRASLAINKKLEEKGKELGLNTGSKKVAKNLVGKFVTSSKFEKIQDVGTMASWSSSNEGRLYVLDGDTTFQISANVSAESKQDQEIAVKLAKAIISSCQ